jgi:single-strand DNA-binding protein
MQMAGEAIVTVTGNLGADAELRKTPTGILVTSFSIGNTPSIKKDNDFIDGETIWFRCFVWGKNATGAANELRKGSRVIVTGRLTQSTYTDKEGAERRTLELNVDSYGIVPKNVAEPVTPNPEIRTEDPIDDPWA